MAANDITGLKKARIHKLNSQGVSEAKVDVLTSSDAVAIRKAPEGSETKFEYLDSILTLQNKFNGKQEFIDKVVSDIQDKILESGGGISGGIIIEDEDNNTRIADITFQEV